MKGWGVFHRAGVLIAWFATDTDALLYLKRWYSETPEMVEIKETHILVLEG